MELCNYNLKNINKNIKVPNYNRNNITPGILHIGVGNFHRAHQAWYINQLFSVGLNHDWGIIGASVRLTDIKIREKFIKQDCLYSLTLLDENQLDISIIGSIIDYLSIHYSHKPIFDKLISPYIRIVSLTITEGGYYLDAKTNKINKEHLDIINDSSSLDNPKTIFGLIVSALKIRMENSITPFTILSCDNLPNNGDLTKSIVLFLAKKIDLNLYHWINDNVTFPNSMVDCITPSTSNKDLDFIAKQGVIDIIPISCEPYRQWVIEDNFVNSRPRFENVGVTFTKNVEKYEMMKLRILNGGHAAIAYPAALLGYEYIFQAMKNPILKKYLYKLEIEEIIPTLPNIKEVNINQYLYKTINRFSNTAMRDTIERLAMDGENRLPKFIIPTLIQRINEGKSIEGLVLVLALWCKYCSGKTDDNRNKIKDNTILKLKDFAIESKSDHSIFLDNLSIFDKINNNKMFIDTFYKWISLLWDQNTLAVITKYIS